MTIHQDYFAYADFSQASKGYAVPVTVSWLSLIVLLFLVFLAARSLSVLPGLVRRRPILWLHACLGTLVVAGWAWGPVGLAPQASLGVAVSLLALRVPYVAWTCGYLLMAGRQGKLAATTFIDQLFWLAPTWSAGDTPYGKGWVHLRRHEAPADEAFARSQLGGLKLLVLATVWRLLLAAIDAGILGESDTMLGVAMGGSLALPALETLLSGEATASVPLSWTALYLELVRKVLQLAITGHVIVGALRLLGFHVFRNTYKPLLAESVVEFWSRYFYYFKELLVDTFFYPTFLRVFKRQPRLRIFAAIFMAACVGNLYFHHLYYVEFLVAGELVRLLTLFAPRWVYCVALAIGIWVSMERQSKRRAGHPMFAALQSTGESGPGQGGLARVRRIAGVWTFFALLNIWTVGDSGIGDRLAFMLSLVGL